MDTKHYTFVNIPIQKIYKQAYKKGYNAVVEILNILSLNMMYLVEKKKNVVKKLKESLGNILIIKKLYGIIWDMANGNPNQKVNIQLYQFMKLDFNE